MTAIRLAATAAAALMAGLFAQGSWAACYVVYGADKQIVYRSQMSPVDLSRPLHETVARIAPGGTLVFSLDSSGCELEIHKLPAAAGAPAAAKGAITTPQRERGEQG